MSSRTTFDKESIVTGHHVFKNVWTPYVGELSSAQERENQHDRYAVSVKKREELVGHMPTRLSRRYPGFWT